MKELVKNRPGAKQVVTGFTPDSQVAERPHQRPDPGGTSSETGTIGGATSPLVSVIIPAYNAERYIARTLESVLSQTYKNIEVLVTNDGSTDQTVEIVESFAEKDSRTRILHQPNLGPSAARNCGIQSSKGEFIAFIDADDVWHKEKTQAQVECFQRSGPSVGLVYSWSMIIDESGNPLTGIAHQYCGNVLGELIYSNFVGNGSSPMIRRSCLKEIGCFNVDLRGPEDWDMYLRIAERYEFQVVPKYHIGYTRVLSSISSDYKNQERDMAAVLDRFQEGHPNIPKSLFRLSRSRAYFYLAGRSNDSGRYVASLGFLLRCLLLDPTRVFSSEYYLTMIKWLVRFTTKPIVALIWGNQLVWGKLQRRLSTWGNQGPVVWYDMSVGGAARPRARLYDRIHNWRMARLRRCIGNGRP
jgi:glycosyltransferase involved in cell wall biosynthesis